MAWRKGWSLDWTGTLSDFFSNFQHCSFLASVCVCVCVFLCSSMCLYCSSKTKRYRENDASRRSVGLHCCLLIRNYLDKFFFSFHQTFCGFSFFRLDLFFFVSVGSCLSKRSNLRHNSVLCENLMTKFFLLFLSNFAWRKLIAQSRK